jgi:hypothetical protein
VKKQQNTRGARFEGGLRGGRAESRLRCHCRICEISAEFGDDSSHQPQSFEIFHDIAALVGDEQQVKVFEGLVPAKHVNEN